MSGSTNFKQWNPDGNNMLTDSLYLTDTSRVSGASSGIFNSTTANKAFYQWAAMTAALAEMLADKGYTVLDGSAAISGSDFDALKAVLANLLTASDMYLYPYIATSTKKLGITTDTGEAVVDSAQSFYFHGAISYLTTDFTSIQRTFALSASKIYHLRFVHDVSASADNIGSTFYATKGITSGLFYCIDTTDVVYNPTALAETDATFDSKHDDMLIARLVTDSSSGVTSTALVNEYELKLAVPIINQNLPTEVTWAALDTATLNWSRTPIVSAPVVMGMASFASGCAGTGTTWQSSWGSLTQFCLNVSSIDRYTGVLQYIYQDSGISTNGSVKVQWILGA